jgi:uracil-DNA glycosylase family protein
VTTVQEAVRRARAYSAAERAGCTDPLARPLRTDPPEGVRDENGYPKIENPRSLRSVMEASKECRGCQLWARATQTVFGEGPRNANVLFVGEQPGDQEDLAGHPFVGPAGRVFDEALAEAGIERKRVFVTNAVKHFKWRASGKRRLHERPNSAEIAACRVWLELELRLVKPQIVVALGATAAQALLGRAFRVTKDRGKPVSSPLAEHVVATVHPSSILRAPDDDSRRAQMKAFVRDLKAVAKLMSGPIVGESARE